MRWHPLLCTLLMGSLLGGCSSGKEAAPGVASPANAPGASAPQAPNAVPVPSGGSAPAEASAGCEARKVAIEAAIVQAGRCAADADCTTLMPGCPFGCFRAVNRSVATEPIVKDIAAYNEVCNQCAYRCRPVEAPLTCQAGVCTLPP